jgi:hypothetical protein
MHILSINNCQDSSELKYYSKELKVVLIVSTVIVSTVLKDELGMGVPVLAIGSQVYGINAL